MRKLIRLALVASVLYGTGAHWAALQGAAWGGMLAARAGESSWAEAVSSTFSGDMPCHVCRIVEKGSSSDSSAAFLRSGSNLELAFTVPPSFSAAPAASAVFESPRLRAASASSRPVVPPPKSVSLV